ncbi:hypothetical protein [Jiella sp. M17.18]|uniref:hypothetical protein n=1 Tax=Jiella sp. M17.18 TaxID=3234247 RepID=UPI0034DF8EFA
MADRQLPKTVDVVSEPETQPLDFGIVDGLASRHAIRTAIVSPNGTVFLPRRVAD